MLVTNNISKIYSIIGATSTLRSANACWHGPKLWSLSFLHGKRPMHILSWSVLDEMDFYGSIIRRLLAWYNHRNLTFIKQQILDSSKLKEFADDNFKFDENGWKFSKRLENTVGKWEIARYEQFLLFPQCFQKACFPGESKSVIVWEWVNNVWK